MKLYRLVTDHKSGNVDPKWVRAEDAERYARLGRAYFAQCRLFRMDSAILDSQPTLRNDVRKEEVASWQELAAALRAIEEADGE